MDRETAITRALGAFWREIETLYPQTSYSGISAEAFASLRSASLAAVNERLQPLSGARSASGTSEGDTALPCPHRTIYDDGRCAVCGDHVK